MSRPKPPEGIGPTGHSPYGYLNEEDGGKLKMAVAYDPLDGVVRVEFGVAVQWLAMPPEHAIALGEALIKKARERK